MEVSKITRRKSSLPIPADNAQLPLWPERVRGAPNALARSALFTCTDKRKPRIVFNRSLIVSVAGQEIRYTGQELRQDDLSVWLQVAHLARMHRLGTQVDITSHALGKAVGWGSGGDAYLRLRESIARMREAAVWVTYPDGTGFSGNLIMSLDWMPAGSGDQRWRLYLDPKILGLFRPDTYTLLDWEARLSLTPLAQWLHGFFASHETPYPYRIDTLHKLCGSSNKTVDSFKKTLILSLQALKDRGLISNFTAEPRTKTVLVSRKPALALKMTSD